MYKERNHIKVFVSSTVYDFESQLDMVYSKLDVYGYDVMMSHKGTRRTRMLYLSGQMFIHIDLP